MNLKTNFIYNSILTASTYLVMLIVYPYVSRTLGLSNIGIVNFVDNLVNYFVFVSMMGVTTVGVREIAAAKSLPEQLSPTFSSLLTLTGITTLLAAVVLLISMYTVPTLKAYRAMLYIGLIKLIFNLFLMEWFFIGMEDFKYITQRTILVRSLFVVSVFFFVQDTSDYEIFYILSTGMVVVNALINLIYSRRFVSFTFRSIHIRSLLKPFLIMGVYQLLTNVYTSLNVVWLGFVTDTDQVGYYTTAVRLQIIIMAILTSFSNILFPRVSNLLAEGKREEYWAKIQTSFDAIFIFAFPTICFMLTAGPELLHVFVGNGFEGAYMPLRIIAPLVLIVGIEQILVIQLLMAMHQDSIVLRNSLIGAAVALLLNILLTAKLGACGSAMVWLAAESVILLVTISVINRKYHYTLPYKRLATYILVYTPLLVASVLLCQYFLNDYGIIAAVGLLTFVYMVVVELYILKNKVALQVLGSIKK